MLRALALALCVAALPLPAFAEGESYDIYVLTFGPGDHPFARFGHTALWVRDNDRQRDVVYNYGTFNFDSPLLLIDFLQGRFQYWLSRGRLDGTLNAYAEEDRLIVAQELDLPPDKRADLVQRLETNALPENRYYKFDYFFDNCSTRIRDIVDAAVGGVVKRAGSTPGDMTHREHALRLASEPMWEYIGLDIGLGPLVDEPRDRYAEAYVPEELQLLLRDTRLSTPEGERPLVKREIVLNQPKARLPSPAAPLVRWPYALALGLAFGGLMLVLQRKSRVGFGALLATWGLLTGLVGWVLLLLWLLTDHAVAYRNANMLLFPPWALSFVVYGVKLARGRTSTYERAFKVSRVTLALATLTVLTTFVGFQDSSLLFAFALPLWTGIVLALRRGRAEAEVTVSKGGKAQKQRLEAAYH